MNTRLSQPWAEGQISLKDDKSSRLITIVSNLVIALVLGIVVTLSSSGWILLG